MPQTQVKSANGDVVATLDLSDQVFGATTNIPLIHQAVVRHLANQRQGTVDTKTRGEVSGTTRKWYRQKGTGHARHGARTAPIFRGGGIAHGPHPRDYRQEMPRKMRRQALRSALSAKLGDGTLIVVDDFQFEAPRTREMVAALAAVAPGHRRLLLVLGEPDRNVQLSARNIPGVQTVVAGTLNTYDVVAAGHVLITRAAINHIEGVLGDGTV
jgi:large subunit ribosomal protein L4